MNGNRSSVYTEVQYMRSVHWIMLIVLGIALLIGWGFIQQIIFGNPWGTNPAPDWMMWLLLLVFGIGFPIFFFKLKLIITVNSDAILINYRPLTTRQIPLSEIALAQARKYSPVREYAGWGVKGWSSQKVAYNVKGNEGVELVLVDGRSVMLGSQQYKVLEDAIQAQLNHNDANH